MKNRILISSGDPAGIGPELALQALSLQHDLDISLGIVGNRRIFERVINSLATVKTIGLPQVLSSEEFFSRGFAGLDAALINIDTDSFDPDMVAPGAVDRHTGAASLDYVNFAIDAVQRGLADAVVTGPIHKEAWHLAGAAFPGHTELFAERCGASRHCMMLAADAIRCALVTVHVGIADVPELLTMEAIVETIELAAEAVTAILRRPARVTVLGLNPHAGEGGLFGRGEEQKVIVPAIECVRQRGMIVTGPLPPDTAFIPSIRESTDVYVCMYHDQGLIPLKALAFDEAVNVTLGIGMVRTSVDHGTALDIAWRGEASDGSMRAAIKMASELCTNRPEH